MQTALTRRICVSLIVALWAAVLPTGPFTTTAAAEPLTGTVLRALGFRELTRASERQIGALQSDLAWIGLYDGPIDGVETDTLRRATQSFKRSIGARVGGRLTPDERKILLDRASATAKGAGFRVQTSDWTGIRLALPLGFLHSPRLFGEEGLSVSYSGRGASSIGLTTRRGLFSAPPRAFVAQVVKQLKSDESSAKILTSGASGPTGYVVYQAEGRHSLSVYQFGTKEFRGLTLSVTEEERYSMAPVFRRILTSLDLFAAQGVRKGDIPIRVRNGDYPGGREAERWYRTMIGSGSGSLVSRHGHILTNRHVVAGCSSVTVNGFPADLIGSDVRLDLAVVRSARFAGREPVRFRRDGAQLGEEIYVIGYPVFTKTQSVNLTKGVVSSTVGHLGDRSQIQITAPVQPGNSGGPVLDRNGLQVAVVVAKVAGLAALASDIENIAWVIRSTEALSIMERFGIVPVMADGGRAARPIEDQTLDWRQITVRIECHK